MVSQVTGLQFYPLRVVTQRLASTPTNRLPHVVPFLSNTIANCRDVFKHSEISEQTKDGSEVGIVVHKLKTQLSTLLQDKRIEARWSAVILIKATVEAGGWSILQGCGAWTRGLLAILNKPEPSTTKKLCLITLTRIFVLTQEHQSLVREITTPSIPPFVTSCLNLITITGSTKESRTLDVTSPLLETVLQVLIKLIPSHPSSLRPFVAQIRSLLAVSLAPVPSDVTLEEESKVARAYPPASTVFLSQHLFALLPQCAPKNAANDEYCRYLRATLEQIHRTADYVFRAIFEDRVSSTKVSTVSASVSNYGDIVNDEIDDILDLSGWRGIEAGVERLEGLLSLLQGFIAVESSSAYSLPVGSIVSTLERLLNIILPAKLDHQNPASQARWNPEVGRDEREGMWLKLPSIHAKAIAVLSTLIDRLDIVSIGILPGLLEQVLWVLRHEKDQQDLRSSVYRIVSQILGIIGPSLSQSTVSSCSPLIRTLCQDLLPEEARSETSLSSTTNGGKIVSSNMNNADSYLKSKIATSKQLQARSDFEVAAASLLISILSNIPTSFLSAPIRNLIDRTAILTNNHRAMLASVLNPGSLAKGKHTSSILPFFARAAATSLEAEAILRPRMPLLQQQKVDRDTIDAEDEEDIDMTTTYNNNLGIERETAPANDEIDNEKQVPNAIPDFLRTARETQDASVKQSERPSTTTGEKKSADSRKRKGEAEDSASIGEVSTPGLLNPLAKRTRLQDEDINQGPVSQTYTTPFAPVYSKQTEKTDNAAVTPLVKPNLLANDNHEGEVANDSDDSFEIPPIILDSDSDDNEEESENDADVTEVGQPS
ncbi:hypothetical protein MMC26_002286 [Xylographa opegraphella]|nr:hypothetical protein [Xylographa opegraphella]